MIEFHTTTRFAWLRQHAPASAPPIVQGWLEPRVLVRLAYNAAFWVFLLPVFPTVSYGTGFVAFTAVITFRFVVNLYTNNMLTLTPEAHERYPFRI